MRKNPGGNSGNYDWQSQTHIDDGTLLPDTACNTRNSVDCRSISEHTFFWNNTAVPIMHLVMMKNMKHGPDIENKKEEVT